MNKEIVMPFKEWRESQGISYDSLNELSEKESEDLKAKYIQYLNESFNDHIMTTSEWAIYVEDGCLLSTYRAMEEYAKYYHDRMTFKSMNK